MEFYSTVRKDIVIRLAGKWMELETVIVNEVTQIQKSYQYMFSLICRS